MPPFDVTFHAVPDERLSDLLGATNAAGFSTPTFAPSEAGASQRRPTQAAATSLREPESDLPDSWRLVRELDGQAYTWPTYREEYPHYAVYAGDTRRAGTVHIALGRAERMKAWGRDRLYIVAFLTSGSPQTPLVEFLATDDYEETRELIAVIRGRDGARSKKMYGLGDSLPQVYVEHFKTVVYSDYIRARGAWSKMAVLIREDDTDTMLNHALVQARRRGDL